MKRWQSIIQTQSTSSQLCSRWKISFYLWWCNKFKNIVRITDHNPESKLEQSVEVGHRKKCEHFDLINSGMYYWKIFSSPFAQSFVRGSKYEIFFPESGKCTGILFLRKENHSVNRESKRKCIQIILMRLMSVMKVGVVSVFCLYHYTQYCGTKKSHFFSLANYFVLQVKETTLLEALTKKKTAAGGETVVMNYNMADVSWVIHETYMKWSYVYRPL